MNASQKLYAAIAVDAQELVRRLLAQLSDTSLWKDRLFDLPLEFNIAQGSELMVRTILDYPVCSSESEQSIKGVLSNHYDPYFRTRQSALSYTVSENRPNMLLVLKEYYESYVGSMGKSVYRTPITSAIDSEVHEAVRLMLCFQVTGSSNVTIGHMQRAAGTHCPEIMLAIATALGMGIHTTYASTSPLIAAVRAGDVHVL